MYYLFVGLFVYYFACAMEQYFPEIYINFKRLHKMHKTQLSFIFKLMQQITSKISIVWF